MKEYFFGLIFLLIIYGCGQTSMQNKVTDCGTAATTQGGDYKAFNCFYENWYDCTKAKILLYDTLPRYEMHLSIEIMGKVEDKCKLMVEILGKSSLGCYVNEGLYSECYSPLYILNVPDEQWNEVKDSTKVMVILEILDVPTSFCSGPLTDEINRCKKRG